MKVLLVCSLGGHLTQMEQLMPAFDGHEAVWVTYTSQRTAALRPAYWWENFGKKPHRYAAGLVKAWRVLRRERPDLIVSTGSEIAMPFLLLARPFGIRTLFIESVSRVTTRSGTGRLAYRIADEFYVQWPQAAALYGPRSRYMGGLL